MKARIALAALMMAAAPAHAQESASARAFVDGFYRAYVPLARSTAAGDPPAIRIMTRRPGSVDAELARALRADYAASARSRDEIVGLDGDPFLGGQDLCPHYQVGRATQVGATYRVEVRGSCSGRVDVVAEVVRRGGRWVFTNFRYPSSHDDLRGVLRQLRDERLKN